MYKVKNKKITGSHDYNKKKHKQVYFNDYRFECKISCLIFVHHPVVIGLMMWVNIMGECLCVCSAENSCYM